MDWRIADLLTAREAAQILGVSRQAVSKRVVLERLRVDGRVLYSRRQVEALAESARNDCNSVPTVPDSVPTVAPEPTKSRLTVSRNGVVE
jgi:hypothetical protein